jgi:hypothetical protein
MDADAAASTLLASRLPPPVDADAAPPAFPAMRLPPAVDAEASPPAIFTFSLPPAVDADTAASTLLASRLPPAVDAEAAASTLLALRLLPTVDADTAPPAFCAFRFLSAEEDAAFYALFDLRLFPAKSTAGLTTRWFTSGLFLADGLPFLEHLDGVAVCALSFLGIGAHGIRADWIDAQSSHRIGIMQALVCLRRPLALCCCRHFGGNPARGAGTRRPLSFQASSSSSSPSQQRRAMGSRPGVAAAHKGLPVSTLQYAWH